MTGNWYAASRDMLDHPVVGIHVPAPRASKGRRPIQPFAAWHWMIARANYASTRLERGQLVVGREHLALEWQWSEQNVRTFLKNLRAHDMVRSNQITNQKGTLLTICNYDKYQSGQPETNQQTTINSPEPNQELTILEQRNKKQISLRDSADAQEMQAALNPGYGDGGVIVHPDRSVTLVNGCRAKWLERFDGNAERLELALEGFAVQENSRIPPESQVGRFLGRLAGDRMDQDRRYEMGIKRNEANGRKAGHPSPNVTAAQQRHNMFLAAATKG